MQPSLPMLSKMDTAQSENKKDQLLAGGITTGIVLLIFLFFWLYQIITPNPPFEFAGEGGMELNFGFYDAGSGDVENTGIGDATSVVTESSSSPSETNPSEQIESAENGEPVLNNEEKPKVKNNETVITPTNDNTEVKPKEDNSSKSLINNFIKNKNKTGNAGGDGNSNQAGNEGDPNGNPNTNGLGGHGNNPNYIGNGNGGGGTGPGINLAGRKIMTPPCKVNDSKEEGVVVVTIKVDKSGNVTDADPNGRGTTTSSSVLKSKARQAALCAKFNPSDKYEEQSGTMVFKFEF